MIIQEGFLRLLGVSTRYHWDYEDLHMEGINGAAACVGHIFMGTSFESNSREFLFIT